MTSKATFLSHTPVLAVLLLGLLLTGCDIPGMGPDPRIAQREAESKAIGGACRHALRGLENCYELNPKASKAAIFDGWKEMDQYMRDNKIEGTPPVVDKDETPDHGAHPEPAASAASRS